MEKKHIIIPAQAEWILSVLTDAGYEAYVVGGCVRDSLLGRKPGDWDITTSATPAQVKKLFKRTVDTGIAHGTVTVMADRVGYEVTTYRIDGEYEDSRHPKSVEFTNQLSEDLKRRDFTINAMAYHPAVGVVDQFDGIGDIRRKMIRCVGEASDRFDEDALRILRAVRFAAQLGFVIDEDTAAAIREKAVQLKNISAERIRTELVKLLVSPNPDFIRYGAELGITDVVLPEYNPQDEHKLKALKNIENDIILRWSTLLKGVGDANAIMRRLKFDNYTRGRVVRLVSWYGYTYEATEQSIRQALNVIGEDIFEAFLKLERAELMADDPIDLKERLVELDEKSEIWKKVISEHQCFNVKGLAINGGDLLRAGLGQGPEIGRILNELTRDVIADQTLNTKEKLIALADNYKKP